MLRALYLEAVSCKDHGGRASTHPGENDQSVLATPTGSRSREGSDGKPWRPPLTEVELRACRPDSTANARRNEAERRSASWRAVTKGTAHVPLEGTGRNEKPGNSGVRTTVRHSPPTYGLCHSVCT
jgi:hypothetical protein